MYRRLINLVGGFWIAAAQVLKWAGLKKTLDPWRYNASLLLRSEPGKMVFGTFGVKHCADDWAGDPRGAREQFAKRLRDFLQKEPLARFAVRDTRHFTRPVPIPSVDIFLVEFGPSGGLLQLTPVLDPAVEPPLDSAQREKVHRALIEAANDTLASDVTERGGMILKRIRQSHSALETAYALRVLQGGFVCFEKGAERFRPPEPLVFRFPGMGMLNFIVREMPSGTADIWIQGQHTVFDGVEFTELFKRLEQHFGGRAEVLFPPGDGSARHALPCPRTGEVELLLLSDFLDFTPLLQFKERLNAQPCIPLPVPATAVTVLLWMLGNQPEFAGETFALVVDVPPEGNRPRSVDFVSIRPWEYYSPAEPLDGFPRFLAAYTDRLKLVRSGRSRAYRTMKRISMLPPFLAWKLMRLNVRGRQRGFGTITVSVLKPATVSIAPVTDLASDRATFAVCDMLLPSENGGNIGWVTVKGRHTDTAKYLDALQCALRTWPEPLQKYA